MIQDDWLQRQFQAVAEAIARAFGRASREEARAELQRAGRGHFGVDPSMALRISADDLRAILGSRDRIRAFARLLAAEARLEPDATRSEALTERARALDPDL